MWFPDFGWNVVTLAFIATIIFSVWGAYGTFDQHRKVWGNRSGEAVSVIWFIALTSLFLAALLYGIFRHDFALIFNGGTRIPFCISVLVGLWKFKGFKPRDIFILATLSCIATSMIILPYKSFFYFTLSGTYIVLTIAQPLEVWRKKKVGVLSIKMLTIYMISGSFWLIYSYQMNNAPVFVITACSVTTLLVTMWLYWRYRD